MYGMVITYSKGKDQPGKVTNPARGQLKTEKEFSLSPFAPVNLVSQDGFGGPVSRYQPRVVSFYRSDSVRLDTRRLNNTSSLHRESKHKKRRERRAEPGNTKETPRSSNIPEQFPNNRCCTLLDKPTVTK